MDFSIFPKENNILFIQPKSLFVENEKNNISINFIFYNIYDNLKYPYVQFLLYKKTQELHFFNKIIDNYILIKEFLDEIISEYPHFQFYKTGLKYFFDIEKNELYIFSEYFKKSDINTNINNKTNIYEVTSYDIINHKGTYNLVINFKVYDFFLRHNSLLYVKNLKTNVKYPCPMTIYKGTKTYYLNHVLLFGDLPFLFKNNYTYTNYNKSVLDSLNKYVENIDYALVIIDNVKFNEYKIKNNISCIFKQNGIYVNNKKIVSFTSNNVIINNTNVKLVYYDTIFNKIYLKVHKNKINNHEYYNLYKYYESIVENNNRIILKFLSFSNNLKEKNEKKSITINKYNYEMNEKTFYFKNNKNNFIVKSSNLNNFYLSEYMYL